MKILVLIIIAFLFIGITKILPTKKTNERKKEKESDTFTNNSVVSKLY